MALLREDKTTKPDFTYFGMFYETTARIAQRFMFGEQKYARGNWREAKEVLTYQQSLSRHLMQYLNGQNDEDHLGAVAANAIILMDLEEQAKKPVSAAKAKRTHTGGSADCWCLTEDEDGNPLF